MFHAKGDAEAAVQQALVALQEKALVWKAARGIYALEEASVADLMQKEKMLHMVPTPKATEAATKIAREKDG